MKNRLKIFFLLGTILVSCNDLDLNPLSEGSSETWYSNETEINQSVSALFNADYWDYDLYRDRVERTGRSGQWYDKLTDNWTGRTGLSAIESGSLSGQTGFVKLTWDFSYECIAAANRVLLNLNRAVDVVSDEKLTFFEANSKFVRASQYARLIFLFGDVPYYTNILDIDESFELTKTSKDVILKNIYEDYDFAIQNLPSSEEYGGNDLLFATKGGALAMKARIALYMGDYGLARDAAKACMDLGTYELHANFRDLFLSSTKKSNEMVFGLPRNIALDVMLPGSGRVKEALSRLAGGFANGGPSWDLLCSFLCTDGLPIDESPLFDPHDPFKNRDPRCNETIVPFGTDWLGFRYQPHPDTLTVLNLGSGQQVSNKDNKSVFQYASYNSLLWRKRVDDSWIGLQADPDNIVIRYADVLLIYAEASIELDEIDQSVLDAMNKVRARAYGIDYTQTSDYPAITTTDQTEARKILRIERRMEFAYEGSRYHDIIRWKLAEKVLNNAIYGILDTNDLYANVVDPGLWYFAQTPSIDEDGIPDFSAMYDAGQIKFLAQRTFDPAKNYLWPIPSSEVQINPNIEQNPGW